MKRLLTAAVLLLMAATMVVPTAAQGLSGANQTARGVKAAVVYSSTEAFSDGRGGAWLRWETESESKNLGFYVYRIVGGQRQQISPLIGGALMQAREEKITSGSYSYFDRFGDANSIYVIESLNANGRRDNSKLIQTQVIADLSVLTGIPTERLINQSKTAQSETLHNDSVLPKELSSEVEANAVQADAVTQYWVASQPGVKIGVKSEGFYRVTREQLETAGFDVTVPGSRWQLYLDGVEQAINVGAGDAYIEFYGRGIDTNESDTQTFFLIPGGPQPGKRIGTTLRRRVGGSVLTENYAQTFTLKERLAYYNNYLNGDVENYYGRTLTPTPDPAFDTISFNLPGVDFNVPNASIVINLTGAVNGSHQTKVKLNGVEVGTVVGAGLTTTVQSFNIPTSALREGANMLLFQTLAGTSDYSFFNSIKVNYARRYEAAQNQISFYVPSYKASYVGNFSSPNVRVFDMTNVDTPVLIDNLAIEQNGATYRAYLPSNRSRVLFAVENSALRSPYSIIPNNPSTLSATTNDGTLIIISYKDWLAQAETWADYRRSQGMAVKVVDIEDVFDEFSYGVVNADAIRSFLSYAKNNWRTAPGYVLLLGDATYDPKNYTGNAAANYIPTRLVDTIYNETGSDESLADFNNDGLAEIPIGRIPVRNAAGVTLALNKVMTYESNIGTAFNRGAVFASDLPNGYDFEALSGRLRDQLPNYIPRVMINRAQTGAHDTLINEINAGKMMVNYSGHGNVSLWAANSFFNNTNAANLTNTSTSIFTMLTCLNGYFIQPNDTLGEVLLKNPNGGAVSAWASTGLTTPDVQEVMALRFYNQVALGNITRLGDLVKDAKSTINFGRDVRLSWVLLGDPTLKVR